MSTSPATSGSMIQKPGTFVLICFGLFALVVGITVLAMTLFPANPSSAHQRVAHFEGEGTARPDHSLSTMNGSSAGNTTAT